MDEKNDSPTDRLDRGEAMALMGRLLAGVPEDRLPLVAAQAVWGMAPWSSRTTYVRAMAAWVAERFRDDLAPVPTALVTAACGRASLADRRFLEAIEECEAAVDQADRCGDGRVVFACRALLARALLQNGEVARGLQVLGDGTGADLPPALRSEVLLALGVADIVRGDLGRAVERFAAGALVPEGLGEAPGTTAQWHRVMAQAGKAHALVRQSRFADAVPLLEAALATARANDAHREVADLQVIRAACGLATGEWEPGRLTAALPSAGRAAGAASGVDFVVGLPADLAGCNEASEAANRLEEAAAERLRVRDATGFLVAGIACAGFHVEAGDRASVARVLDLTGQAVDNLDWDDARAPLEAARVALEV